MTARIDRLQELRDWFATVPEHKVHMEGWTAGFDPRGRNENHSCLTVGCLWGWGAVYEPFRELGVKVDNSGIPMYQGQLGLDAFELFFGVGYTTARQLCSPSAYPVDQGEKVSKQQVLDRLDQFIGEIKEDIRQ